MTDTASRELREAMAALIAPTLAKGDKAHPIDQAWAESIRAALEADPPALNIAPHTCNPGQCPEHREAER